jgi:hypothetical protein
MSDLIKRADKALEYLLNGTGKRDEGPYLDDSEEQMNARHDEMKQRGIMPEWDDYDVPIRIADDCNFCAVHGFEGNATWGTAQAIVDAGPLIYDMREAIKERDALKAELADAKKLASDLICENQGLKHKIDMMNKEQTK